MKHENISNLLTHLLMNHPTLHSLVKAGTEGKGKQPARKATYTCISNKQPTNTAKVDSDVCSVQTKRRKMEGDHKSSNLFIAMDSLPIYIYG